MSLIMNLPFDNNHILERILENLDKNNTEGLHSLLALSITNKRWNTLASRCLYSEVDYNLTSGLNTVDPKSNLTASRLPRNASHVQHFKLICNSYLPPPDISGSVNELKLLLNSYPNLRAFTFRPKICDSRLAVAVIRALPQVQQLLNIEYLDVKIPYVFPEIPSSQPLAEKKNLHVIEEEEEEEDAEEDVHETHPDSPVSENSSNAGRGAELTSGESDTVPPYEYKPLEVDQFPIIHFNCEPSLLCIIPQKEFCQIRHLTLSCPNSDTLFSLPEVLGALDKPLLSLCFEGNCGSVTPGALISLIPVSLSLRHFALGIAYCIKYDDLLRFLSAIPNLLHLTIFHYFQTFGPDSKKKGQLSLLTLKSLKVVHGHAVSTSRTQMLNLCAWILQISSLSLLEDLEIICEDIQDSRSGDGSEDFHDLDVCFGVGICVDGLATHLSTRHGKTEERGSTLRILKFPAGYLSTKGLRCLLTGCDTLQELEIRVRKRCLDEFGEITAPVYNTLRSVNFCNVVDIVSLYGAKASQDDREKGISELLKTLVTNIGDTHEDNAEPHDKGAKATGSDRRALRRLFIGKYGCEGSWSLAQLGGLTQPTFQVKFLCNFVEPR